jgi:sugar transferase (PEP-CTERM/EpsH1 system associated)
LKPDLIFLAHRIPYPPDKGEKIRSHHMLRHLAADFRIHLGCLTAEPDEARHVDTLRQWCASIGSFPMDRRRQKLMALARLRPGRPLMLDYYRLPALQAWVAATRAALPKAGAFVSTVAMMPYLESDPPPRLILDAMDIDSEKWTAYAATAPRATRFVWAREGRTLLAYERRAAARADATLFVSPSETARFAQLAPETAGRLHAIENGVDLDRFSPDTDYGTPFSTPGPHLVFTGHMDYWPNADAVAWFAAEIMPTLRATHPTLAFHIVGANPGPATRALATAPGIHVTGRVPDIRPFLAWADVCVAPLRIARGIQNKVLEAMAMGRPVVASPQAFEGVRAMPGEALLVANGAGETGAAIRTVLDGGARGLGPAARAAMERGYAWAATLAPLDNIVAAARLGL